MSISNDILQHIAKTSVERYASLGPQEIALDLGEPPEKISKLLWSLEHTGRIEILRDSGRMVGIKRIVRLESAHGGGPRRDSARAAVNRQQRARTNGSEPTITLGALRAIKTPQLDRYEDAKVQAAEIAQGDSMYLEVSFRESPLAEEALRIKTALRAMDAKYAELSTQYRTLQHQWDQHMDREHHRPLAAEVEKFRREAEGD